VSLEPGGGLGHYRLVEQIGQGGMGVVWKALDTTLDREVAIKVLPDLMSADPERLARFEREAKLLASLNHPGIATIHGFHEAGGVRFLAMELVAGDTLAHRLENGALPVDEALAIAAQVAEALEAAHEQGVVHRDLKPANIQITPDGKAKVLDFGLAKAFEPEVSSVTGSMSPTLTTPATRAGVILGTAAYMSPEQAKGRHVDRRADIWAFGCVLYEMLTGRRPFGGEGVSEILAAIIMAPLDLEPLPQGAPVSIRRLLKRCLEKDPKRRLRDIGEARFVIEERLSGVPDDSAAGLGGAAVQAADGRRGFGWPLLAAVAVVAAAAAVAVVWSLTPGPSPAPLRRFELPAEGPHRSGVQGRLVAISPDGRRVAYAEKGGIWVRDLSRLEARKIPVSADPSFIFWSPDSAWVAYHAGGKIWKAPADGGSESVVIADAPGQYTGGSGGTWGPDGMITLARGDGGLYQIPARGGDSKEILKADPDTESDFHNPEALPDGSGVLFVIHVKGGRPDTLSLLSGGEHKTLLRIEGQDIWHPVYSPTGHILYRRQPTNPGIWALPFSLSKHEVTGEPFLVVPEGDLPSVSSDGTLVHVRGVITRQTRIVWVDRSGQEVGTIGEPEEQWPFPSLSPDDRNVAITASENESYDVWIHDAERGTRTRLTFDAKSRYGAEWTPDGRQVAFNEGSDFPFEVGIKAADGTGQRKEIAKGWGPAFSPDGRYLITTFVDPNTNLDLWITDLQGDGKPAPLVAESGAQFAARVSPSGDYFAYVSDETGAPQVYMRRFPSGEGKWQVSVKGGLWPRWSRDGRHLYFAFENDILEVEVGQGSAPRLGSPTVVFERKPLGWPLLFNWPPGFDVTSDEKRFVLCQAVQGENVSEGIVVVENWLSQFDRPQP